MSDVTTSYGMSFDFIAFFWVFSYIFDENSCLNYYIFSKHPQIVCLINIHFFLSQHAKCDFRLWKVLRFVYFFLGIFLCVNTGY